MTYSIAELINVLAASALETILKRSAIAFVGPLASFDRMA
jgi:hypothetical protein